MEYNKIVPYQIETILLEKDGIKYCHLKQEHCDELHSILSDAFKDEPLTSMLGGNNYEWWKLSF